MNRRNFLKSVAALAVAAPLASRLTASPTSMELGRPGPVTITSEDLDAMAKRLVQKHYAEVAFFAAVPVHDPWELLQLSSRSRSILAGGLTELMAERINRFARSHGFNPLDGQRCTHIVSQDPRFAILSIKGRGASPVFKEGLILAFNAMKKRLIQVHQEYGELRIGELTVYSHDRPELRMLGFDIDVEVRCPAPADLVEYCVVI